jgi:hypothetical protein
MGCEDMGCEDMGCEDMGCEDMGCESGGGVAEAAAAIVIGCEDDGAATAVTELPHFGQNRAWASIGVPHLLQ